MVGPGVETEHPHLPRRRLAVALQALHGRGLARPVRAEQGRHRARCHLEAEPVDRHPIAVADDQIPHLDGRRTPGGRVGVGMAIGIGQGGGHRRRRYCRGQAAPKRANPVGPRDTGLVPCWDARHPPAAHRLRRGGRCAGPPRAMTWDPPSSGSERSTRANVTWPPNATTCGPGSNRCPNRSARCGVRATWTRPRWWPRRVASWAFASRSSTPRWPWWPTRSVTCCCASPTSRRPTPRTGPARPTTWSSASRTSTRPPTSPTNACPTGTSAPSWASSTWSGGPRSRGRCSCSSAGSGPR